MSKPEESVEPNVQKKGFWAFLKESIAKSNDGCGPGCGCHAAGAKKAKDSEVAEDGRKT